MPVHVATGIGEWVVFATGGSCSLKPGGSRGLALIATAVDFASVVLPYLAGGSGSGPAFALLFAPAILGSKFHFIST